MRETYLPSINDNDIFLADLTSTTNVNYYGYAKPGTAQATAEWRIFVIDLDPSTQAPIGKRFAGGTFAYVHAYSARTSLAYS